MDITTIFSMALHISDPWFISELDFDPIEKVLRVSVDFRRGAKFEVAEDDPEGSKGLYGAYDTVQKEWRHLNFFEHACYLKARIPRVQNKAGKVRVIDPPWSGRVHGLTEFLEAYILLLVQKMPVKAASDLLKISDSKIWEVVKRYVDAGRAIEVFDTITAIGIDETAQKKHHGYISLFVDLDKKRTVFVGEGKAAEVVRDFKNDLVAHQGVPHQITDVSCDMSAAFIKGVKENLPEAAITFDKFHIVKLINEAVDKVRRAEVISTPLLKNTRYLFLKNRTNLTAGQDRVLQDLEMSKLNLKTIQAYHIKENFKAIYEAQDLAEFKQLLTKWYIWASASDLPPMVDVAQTIMRHWDGVVEWKRSQINNGILEGLNSVIQAAKAKARGYRNFEYFRAIVYLITGKLNLSAVNPHYQPT